MNLLQIEYFNSIARHLNFTAAAKSLFVTQPALSKQIALLEKDLGVQLIDRNKRTVRLTPAGVVLFKEFENINIQINNALEKVRCVARGSNGSISIGCLETVNFDMFFPELIKKFSSLYPDIKIFIERGGFRYLREKLQADIFDIIFTNSFDIHGFPNLLFKNMCKRSTCIIMSNTYHLADRENLSFRDLSNEPFITVSHHESPGIAALALETAKIHGFKNIKQVHNVDTLLSYLELGLGFALLDRSIGDNRKHNFKFYDLPENEPVIYIVGAWKKENLNPALPNFLSIISS